jgi:hypothetical protein
LIEFVFMLTRDDEGVAILGATGIRYCPFPGKIAVLGVRA